MEKKNRGDRSSCDLIVIGASAGGVGALRRLVSFLPENFPAAICVVLHIGQGPSYLPEILSRSGKLAAIHAKDGLKIERSKIYIAPPNSHVLVKPGELRVIMGAKENWHRPAINPLFRTAAVAYRDRVAGIILSGALDDGAIGLKAIKHHGGTTIAQDPDEAHVPDMPMNAIRKDEIDHVLKVSDIAALLVELTETNPKASSEIEVPDVEVEPDILEMPMQEKKRKITTGKPTGVTCPECGGVVWEQSEEGLIHYRCHVGHAYSAGIMKEAKNQNVEAAMWNAIRILQEKNALLKRMAAVVSKMETRSTKEELLKEAEDAKRYASQIRTFLYREEKEREDGEGPSRQRKKTVGQKKAK